MLIDFRALVIIGLVAVLAPLVVELPPRLRVPVVVAEIGFGIVIGPDVLGWGEGDDLLGRVMSTIVATGAMLAWGTPQITGAIVFKFMFDDTYGLANQVMRHVPRFLTAPVVGDTWSAFELSEGRYWLTAANGTQYRFTKWVRTAG